MLIVQLFWAGDQLKLKNNYMFTIRVEYTFSWVEDFLHYFIRELRLMLKLIQAQQIFWRSKWQYYNIILEFDCLAIINR